MKISTLKIRNYRKLEDISLSLDSRITLIVGRNNTGKTSTAEIFRSFLLNPSPNLKFADFCCSCLPKFFNAAKDFANSSSDSDFEYLRASIPSIDIEMTLNYEENSEEYGLLSDFIIDLDDSIFETKLLLTYRLKDGELSNFFNELQVTDESSFYKKLKNNINRYFESVAFVVDPSNDSNRSQIDLLKIKKLFLINIINAQRGLNDETYAERDVLGKSLGTMFNNATSINAPSSIKAISSGIQEEVDTLQQIVDSSFQEKVAKLLPNLVDFGYPGLGDTELSASTELNIKALLDSHTKVFYKQNNLFKLPETYNGLGIRNLIFILFRIYECFLLFRSQEILPKGQIIFIEEPEAHLHPQMQEVFISQLDSIVEAFQKQLGQGNTWPIQFVVTTHSSHIANKANFNQIRYFLSKNTTTKVKDLKDLFEENNFEKDQKFLHKYLTLTKCDLYFADLAILVEGPTERILLPEIINKFEKLDVKNKLKNKYLSVLEVGGAYAHHFYNLLKFLELKTLIITDIDSSKLVQGETRISYPKAMVSESLVSTNASLKSFFKGEESCGHIQISQLNMFTNSDKVENNIRVAYQVPEKESYPCGRSFEDAFILANLELFDLNEKNDNEIERCVFDKAEEIGKGSKADFAIKYAIQETNWNTPRYIMEGLTWLVENEEKRPSISLINDCPPSEIGL